ncbi:MAG: Cys-tRNA(Pro) deacylase [Oscillospiraceae bacterium]|nr:Cys-tRNA(Pro) deacylase [Oscillospiraceae bacterium]
MAKASKDKTNVMRLLEQKKIPYTPHSYPHADGPVDGVTVAGLIGVEPARVFKTLVARGASKAIYVFVIPVARELDLKKAAKSVGEKSIAMIHVSEITGLTGYVRGGCSPVGMKKCYRTVLDTQAQRVETLLVSAGKIGYQVELAPDALLALVGGTVADLTVDA